MISVAIHMFKGKVHNKTNLVFYFSERKNGRLELGNAHLM